MSNLAGKKSKNSTSSSPAQTLSWRAAARIYIARSVMRFAKSFALWLAPELAPELKETDQ